MAHISRDENLLRAFAAGEDVHRATAAEIFNREPHEVTPEERRYAKVINFGLIYGMSAFGVAQPLGLERATAQAYIDSYFTRYPGVARYMQETREQARERGYVETVFGRRLWLPEIRAANPAGAQGAERAAINAPMQGTAADLIKLSMIAVQDWLDARTARPRSWSCRCTTNWCWKCRRRSWRAWREAARADDRRGELAVPLVVDVGVGANWEQAH